MLTYIPQELQADALVLYEWAKDCEVLDGLFRDNHMYI